MEGAHFGIVEFYPLLLLEPLQHQCLFVAYQGRETDRFGFLQRFDRSGERFGVFRDIPVLVVVTEASRPAERLEIPLVLDPEDHLVVVVDGGKAGLVVEVAAAGAVGAGGGDLLELPGVRLVDEVPLGQRPDGADRRTLSAVGAVGMLRAVAGNDDRLLQLVPHGVGVFGGRLLVRLVDLVAAAGTGLEGAVSDHILADGDAALADDTEPGVVMEHGRPVDALPAGIGDSIVLRVDAQLQRIVLELTLPVLVTDAALQRVVDVVDLHDRPALFENLFGLCDDLHPILRFGVAGVDPLAVGLDQADPAGQGGRTAGQVTDGGDEDPVGTGRIEDILPLLRPALHTVNRNGDLIVTHRPSLLSLFLRG